MSKSPRSRRRRGERSEKIFFGESGLPSRRKSGEERTREGPGLEVTEKEKRGTGSGNGYVRPTGLTLKKKRPAGLSKGRRLKMSPNDQPNVGLDWHSMREGRVSRLGGLRASQIR